MSPVPGGDLRVGVWEPADGSDAAPAVLLIHGVTASHLSWPSVAERLPGAGDRSRPAWARSQQRTRGTGRARRARARPRRRARRARRRPRCRRRALDGRVRRAGARRPVSRAGVAARARRRRAAARRARRAVVGRGDPARARARRPSGSRCGSPRSTSTSTSGARTRRSARDWTPALEAYLAYDLVGEAPELRPATSYATLEEDSIDQNTGTAVVDALAALRHPTVLLTAERGLLDQVPPLYSPERLPGLLAAYPGLRHEAVDDVQPLHDRDVASRRGCRRRRRAGGARRRR